MLKDIDACVTDPPYGLSFMGKAWDYDVPDVEIWTEVFKTLKTGAHLLSFFGSRTYHRGAIPIEDAGFEIRDQLMWLYGSGFPKSLNIGKAVDKLQGNEREVIGTRISAFGDAEISETEDGRNLWGKESTKEVTLTKGASEYEGWGTALKPAHEPIVMARKPFKGSVANNVLERGTGGINIDECRVDGGRFPANLMHDGSEVVQDIFPETGKSSGGSGISSQKSATGGIYGEYKQDYKTQNLGGLGDTGTAARYFYCPKTSKKDRDEGMDALATKNNHPTVKPTELMRYLCRLVTPKGGVVVDPFMGSGSTGKACMVENFSFIGIEMSQEYFDIACARIEAEHKKIQQRLI